MRRDDWPTLLNATQWCRGITRGLVECLPGFILSAPFYLTKRVKSYYMRAHVTHGVTSNVDDFLSQPELSESLLCLPSSTDCLSISTSYHATTTRHRRSTGLLQAVSNPTILQDSSGPPFSSHSYLYPCRPPSLI